LDSKIYGLIGEQSIKYNNGTHVNHQLTGYHRFSTSAIGANEKVLDVGCGQGLVAYEFAKNCSAEVCGVDINKSSIEYSRSSLLHPKLTFHHTII